MNFPIELRHAASGQAKNFATSEEAAAFLRQQNKNEWDEWEGWQHLRELEGFYLVPMGDCGDGVRKPHDPFGLRGTPMAESKPAPSESLQLTPEGKAFLEAATAEDMQPAAIVPLDEKPRKKSAK